MSFGRAGILRGFMSVRVHSVAGEFEAQQIKAFLEAHGVASEFRGEALRKTHGLTLDGLGMVDILVAPGDAERARELLARAEAGELALDENPEIDRLR